MKRKLLFSACVAAFVTFALSGCVIRDRGGRDDDRDQRGDDRGRDRDDRHDRDDRDHDGRDRDDHDWRR